MEFVLIPSQTITIFLNNSNYFTLKFSWCFNFLHISSFFL